MNDRKHYLKSPSLKHSIGRGDFDQSRYMSRTFNRRLRMGDTFTKVLPSYNHTPNSTYIPSYTHLQHQEITHDILGKSIK